MILLAMAAVLTLRPPASPLVGPSLAPVLAPAAFSLAARPLVLTPLLPLAPLAPPAPAVAPAVLTTVLGRLSAELPGAAPQVWDLAGGKEHADRTFALKLGEAGGSVSVPEGAVPAAERLVFSGVGPRDVYNPTAPFLARLAGRQVEVLAARVEARQSEASEAVFFERAGAGWRPLAKAPVFKLQDPFFARFGDELIVGGVETFPREGGGLGYRTVFYRGKDLSELKPFARGPDGMKDIRLIALPSGKILVLTRPQGKVGGRGKIAVTTIEDLAALGGEAIEKASVLEDLFAPEEWGGANELHLLKNGLIGVLGHVASFDEKGDRHYYPMVFAVDPATGRRSPMRVLLKRAQLPAGASKRPDLADVLFSGGLVRRADGTAELYVGAGDAEVYRVTIPDPFAEYEDPGVD